MRSKLWWLVTQPSVTDLVKPDLVGYLSLPGWPPSDLPGSCWTLTISWSIVAAVFVTWFRTAPGIFFNLHSSTFNTLPRSDTEVKKKKPGKMRLCRFKKLFQNLDLRILCPNFAWIGSYSSPERPLAHNTKSYVSSSWHTTATACEFTNWSCGCSLHISETRILKSPQTANDSIGEPNTPQRIVNAPPTVSDESKLNGNLSHTEYSAGYLVNINQIADNPATSRCSYQPFSWAHDVGVPRLIVVS